MLYSLNESTIDHSQIFSDMNRMSGEDQMPVAINLIRTAKRLNEEDIINAALQLRQMRNTMTIEGLKEWKKGNIVLLYNNNRQLSVSQTLPYMVLKSQGTFKAYIFLDNHITEGNNGYTIQSTKLNDLLVSALISLKIRDPNNYMKLMGSMGLRKILMTVYTMLVGRVLNREYFIRADKMVSDKLDYLVNRFFLTSVMKVPDSSEDIHRQSIPDRTLLEENDIVTLEAMYMDASPKTVGDMIEMVKQLSPAMKHLVLPTFIAKWSDNFYAPAVLAMDTVEYLIFTILCLLNGSMMVNNYMSKSIKEIKGMNTFLYELAKIAE